HRPAGHSTRQSKSRRAAVSLAVASGEWRVGVIPFSRHSPLATTMCVASSRLRSFQPASVRRLTNELGSCGLPSPAHWYLHNLSSSEDRNLGCEPSQVVEVVMFKQS